ncbi:MAG TPA: ATP-binding protein [Patescibacteria group bacterium]
MGITQKTIGLSLLVALVPLAIAGALLYAVTRHSLQTQTLENLYTIADVEANRYAAELRTSGPGALKDVPLPEFGATGEAYVIREQDGVATLVTPRRFAVDGDTSPIGIRALAQPESTDGNATDYRGREVLAVTRQFAPGWALVVKIDRAEALTPVRVIRNTFLILGAVITLLVAALSAALGRWMTRPIRELTAIARSFRQGKLRRRAEVRSRDEVGELAEAFNQMAGRLERSDRDLSQKVKAQTRLLSRNVEELRKQKRRAERAKARAEAFLQAVGDALLVVDTEGKIVMVNRKFEQLLGWSREEAIGKQLTEVCHTENEQGRRLPRSQRPVIRALSGRRAVQSGRYFLRRRDGTRFCYETSAAPIVWQGKPAGAVAIFRNIDDRRALQRRQQQFISMASHELRTPLTALMGYLSMAEQQPESAPRFTERAFKAAQRLGRLVEDLLYATKIDHDKLPVTLTRFNPSAALWGEVETLQTMFDRKEITLAFEDRLDPEDRIRADKDKYVQVVVNLLDNALKYTPSGGYVTVSVETAGRDVVTMVSDTGVGIRQRNLHKVFDKFYREENKLSIAAGGAGLGLPIAKDLVERQGGKLEIDSRPDAGTTVRLRFARSVSRTRKPAKVPA